MKMNTLFPTCLLVFVVGFMLGGLRGALISTALTLLLNLGIKLFFRK
jgi:hypothetical protein